MPDKVPTEAWPFLAGVAVKVGESVKPQSPREVLAYVTTAFALIGSLAYVFNFPVRLDQVEATTANIERRLKAMDDKVGAMNSTSVELRTDLKWIKAILSRNAVVAPQGSMEVAP